MRGVTLTLTLSFTGTFTYTGTYANTITDTYTNTNYPIREMRISKALRVRDVKYAARLKSMNRWISII